MSAWSDFWDKLWGKDTSSYQDNLNSALTAGKETALQTQGENTNQSLKDYSGYVAPKVETPKVTANGNLPQEYWSNTTTPSSTQKPTVSLGSTSSNKTTSLYEDAREKLAQLYKDGEALALNNLNNARSYADKAFVQSTNPYGAAAENLNASGLSMGGGYSNYLAGQNLANSANFKSDAQGVYSNALQSLKSAQTADEISLIMSELTAKQNEANQKFYAEQAEKEQASNDYRENLEEVQKLKEANPNLNVYAYLLSKGMSSIDAQNIANALKGTGTTA